MPKTKISEFSATPANNTDIDSINIAEGCAPSGINDAIRELMAQLKDFQTGAVGDSFNGPIGATTASTGAFTTLSASSTLGVTGVSTLTGGAVVQGLTVGRGAGAIATNTAVGSGALQANTTGTVSVALGYQAGYAKTTAGANVAIGHQSQYAGTTGDDNVSVGTYALYNNTGANNVAIGSVALGNAANTGSSIVAVGRDALRNNTTGSNLTAVGYQAGYSNQTGAGATYIGYQAGYSTTSTSNTFVGFQTGYNVTSAIQNVFVGYWAGLNTTGSANTFVGAGTSAAAGYSVTTGAKNTILGGYTGNQNGLDIRTSNSYVVISDGDGNRVLSSYALGTTALGNSAVPQTGTGITFPATQNASSDANTLDDYEEGTWTPSYSGGLSGVTYGTVRNGFYTKIGNQVTVWFGIMTDGLTVTSSSLNISGLPFTSKSSLGAFNTVNLCSAVRWVSNPPVVGEILTNTATIGLYSNFNLTGAGTDPTLVTTGNMATGSGNRNVIYGTATYTV